LLTTLLSALAMDYFWLPPTFAFGMREPGDLIGFVLFLGVGLLVSALNARLLQAQRDAEAAAAELRREVDERRTAEEAAAKLAKLAEELESSVERYRHHFKRHLAGVFRAQRDGRIVECSDAFARLPAAAAHESNGPLTTVLTNLGLLRLDGEPAARVDKALEAARRIQDTLHRMTRTDSGIAPTGRGIPARPESKC